MEQQTSSFQTMGETIVSLAQSTDIFCLNDRYAVIKSHGFVIDVRGVRPFLIKGNQTFEYPDASAYESRSLTCLYLISMAERIIRLPDPELADEDNWDISWDGVREGITTPQGEEPTEEQADEDRDLEADMFPEFDTEFDTERRGL